MKKRGAAALLAGSAAYGPAVTAATAARNETSSTTETAALR